MQTLLIGLGHSGTGPHLPVLNRLRATAEGAELFADGPIVGCDPQTGSPGWTPGVTVVRSLADTRRLLEPATTVAHVCTSPGRRTQVIEELAKAGFRKLIVEKPLAAHHRDLNRICWLRKRYGLDLVVVSHWLTATLTERMLRIADSPELGTLRTITVHQHKPRFLRSLTTSGHPTAFDVEIPHSLAAVLKLAGPATLLDADWTTMRCQDQEIPRLGGARIALEHASGARSDLVSDLMSPRRERRITLRFEHGTVVGDYPLSEDDDHAQLRIEAGDRHTHAVFRDDALASFFRRAYTHFHRPSARLAAEFALHREAVRLLCTAKNLCAAADRAAPSIPAQRKALSHRAGH